MGALEWIKLGMIQEIRLSLEITTQLHNGKWKSVLYVGTDDSDPYLLTTYLLGAPESKGVEILQASATKLSIEDNRVRRVHVVGADGTTFFIPCDSVVLTLDPEQVPYQNLFSLIQYP